MAEPSARRKQGDQPALLDAELAHLPPELRWREWMGRVEAVIFAASTPVSHERLARVVGNSCNLDLIIDDIRAELAGRPYELVAVAGGWQHRTRKVCALFHRCAFGTATGQGADSDAGSKPLSQSEALVLTAIAYFQPITRGELSRFFGKEVSRDRIGVLRSQDLIASGPRSPQPGAPYTYVTTKTFLAQFGLDRLRDLPERRSRTPVCCRRTSCWQATLPGGIWAFRINDRSQPGGRGRGQRAGRLGGKLRCIATAVSLKPA